MALSIEVCNLGVSEQKLESPIVRAVLNTPVARRERSLDDALKFRYLDLTQNRVRLV